MNAPRGPRVAASTALLAAGSCQVGLGAGVTERLLSRIRAANPGAHSGCAPSAKLPDRPGTQAQTVIGRDGSVRNASWDATDDPLRWRMDEPPE